MDSNTKRRLAAIMFTDIVGWTITMTKDETKKAEEWEELEYQFDPMAPLMGPLGLLTEIKASLDIKVIPLCIVKSNSKNHCSIGQINTVISVLTF